MWAPVEGGRVNKQRGLYGCRTPRTAPATRDPRCAIGERFHAGIDVGASEGTPLIAVASGVVDYASNVNGNPGFSNYGKVVLLRVSGSGHPWFLMYAHMADVAVATGDTIRAGQVIGTVGRTSGSVRNPGAMFGTSGAHLHFEVSARRVVDRAGTGTVDPLGWLLAGGMGLRDLGHAYRISKGDPSPDTSEITVAETTFERMTREVQEGTDEIASGVLALAEGAMAELSSDWRDGIGQIMFLMQANAALMATTIRDMQASGASDEVITTLMRHYQTTVNHGQATLLALNAHELSTAAGHFTEYLASVTTLWVFVDHYNDLLVARSLADMTSDGLGAPVLAIRDLISDSSERLRGFARGALHGARDALDPGLPGYAALGTLALLAGGAITFGIIVAYKA